MANLNRLPVVRQEVWEWQYDGACVGMDSSKFFSPDAERGSRRRNRETAAKAVCAGCPVIERCREHALTVREPYGVWGGMTMDERKAYYAAEHAPVVARIEPVPVVAEVPPVALDVAG